MSEQGIGAIKCGAFIAVNTGYNSWQITCERLPNWKHDIEASRATASRAVIQLQAEFRSTWEVQDK